MRKIIIVLSMLLPVYCGAQITLNQAGYPSSVLGTDSLKITAAASSFPALTPSAGGMWDLSTVTDSTPTFFAYRVHGITPYQFADSDLFQFSGFSYQGNVESDISASEINEYGVSVSTNIFSLTPYTSGPFDSLVIDSQTLMYLSPRTKIAFPCTYNTMWSSSYSSDLGIQLTFLLNGDTSAPGFLRRYTTEKDSVTGWGKMRILDASGMPSDYINVLQVQTRITHTDSFYLKGAPFNGTLLSILGVMQGQKDTVYEQNYYRVGELTPLAQVEFRDAAYTQPYKATTHTQRLSNLGVPGIIQENDVTIYPNPASGGDITIDLPLQSAGWSYKIVGMKGRCIAEDVLALSGGKYVVQLRAGIAPGIYVMHLYGKGGATLSHILEIR